MTAAVELADPLGGLGLERALADPAVAARLHAAYDQATRFREAAVAANTVRAYRTGWTHFTTWCGEMGIPTDLPVHPGVVVLYLCDRPNLDAAWATINGRLAAIRWVHVQAGHPSPTAHPEVEKVRDGMRRTLDTASQGKAPLRWPQLVAMVQAVRADQTRQPLTRLRDTALLLLLAAAGLRRSEAVAIDTDDLVLVDGQGFMLTIGRSKTDQGGKGQHIPVPYNHVDANACPVRAIQAWCDAAGIAEHLGRRGREHQVPVFQQINRHGNLGGRLGDRRVWVIVLDARDRAGLGHLDLSPHSARHGLVTGARAAGVSDLGIMATTRHTRLATTARYDDTMFEGAAATAIYEAHR